MPKPPDPRLIICPLTSAGFKPGAEGGMESPLWAEVDDLEIEPSPQELQAMHDAAAVGLGDCNRDCCHCALRWYARRMINRKDN